MTGYSSIRKSGRALTVSSAAPVRPAGSSYSVAAGRTADYADAVGRDAIVGGMRTHGADRAQHVLQWRRVAVVGQA
jgi:hypothetical protein